MSRRFGLVMALASLTACSAKAPPPTPTPARDSALIVVPSPEANIPTPVPPRPAIRYRRPVRLAFVGDINLGTTTLPDGVPPDTGRGLLDAARPALLGDLVVGNFEGVLADTGTSEKCERMRAGDVRRRPPRRERGQAPDTTAPRPGCYAFRTPIGLAPRLVEAGFTHLNLANNHANDFGPAGRASTERTLDSLGLGVYGPLGRIAIDTVGRGDSLTTVGLIGFATYPYAYDLLDIARSAAVVDSVRPLVDLLIVTFHGGSEGVRALNVRETAESLGREPRGDLRRWARAVIDAGADAVVGHGPHVLRGVEYYRERPVVYSLGNFLTYRGFNLEGLLGVTGVLQLEFAPDGRLARARLVPMVQRPREGPAPDPDNTALSLIRRLSAEDFGARAADVSPDGELIPPP
ncbi:MAG TPA: CapA family protein [Gemmatimonadales bacterium]|nr:CapA family protein [Gemmatimonadales bacterium]